MTTLAKINKHLKKLNIEVEILPGKGYVYFAGPATDHWKETIVPGLFNVKNLTNEQGYELFQEMSELNSFGKR